MPSSVQPQLGHSRVSSQRCPPASLQHTGWTSSESHSGHIWSSRSIRSSASKRTTSIDLPLGRRIRRTECLSWFSFIGASWMRHLSARGGPDLRGFLLTSSHFGRYICSTPSGGLRNVPQSHHGSDRSEERRVGREW